ncbi:MAG TPA: TetR/AcrR family transcriptional regulator [Pseudomonadales bacterium]|nr:TetR/AcrR family transcriptional regulator [Pseudomonadales bacterium]
MNTVPAHAQMNFGALKGEARERILRVALVEFAQRGFDGVSTTEIAKAANVTQPLIHYHFKNKEALWRATADELFVSFYRHMNDMLTFNPNETPQVQMARMVKRYVQFAAMHPEWTRFVVREGSKQTERLGWLVDTWIRPLLAKLADIHRTGTSQGWLRPIPLHQMLSLIMSTGSLYAISPMIKMLYGVDSTGEEELSQYIDLTTRMLCNTLLVTPVQSHS